MRSCGAGLKRREASWKTNERKMKMSDYTYLPYETDLPGAAEAFECQAPSDKVREIQTWYGSVEKFLDREGDHTGRASRSIRFKSADGEIVELYWRERRCTCDNCGDVTEEANLKPLAQVHHLASRLDAGAEIPAGVCLDCGAFSYLNLTTRQYAWKDDVSLWLSNALALTRGKKGKGLNLNPLYADILYSDIWKVEATLTDAGIIGKSWHEVE
jgi:hypothetical protein